MGLVAALSGLGSVTVPVVVGAVSGVVLAPLQLLGVGMAGLAAMAAGGASREGVSGRALVLAGSPRWPSAPGTCSSTWPRGSGPTRSGPRHQPRHVAG